MKKMLWDKMLNGRSAHIVTTMDAPAWIDHLFLGRIGIKQLRSGILKFCGFNPVTFTTIGSVRRLKETQIQSWLTKVYALGQNSAKNV